MNAHKLYMFLHKLQESGVDLKKVKVNYRETYDHDVKPIRAASEDLFDDETNYVLESIVLLTDARSV